MAMIQVVMFCVMLGQGLFILAKGPERKIETSPYRTPDNLLELSLLLSVFVVCGACYASLVIIYLTCRKSDMLCKAHVAKIKSN